MVLARIKDFIEPEKEQHAPAYDGFPWWHALFAPIGRETKSAELMKNLLGITPYVPEFSRLVGMRRSPGRRRWRRMRVLPGFVFVPQSYLAVRRRDEVLEMAGVKIAIRNTEGGPALIPRSAIERIRIIEAGLNLPVSAPGVFGNLFKVGQKVRVMDSLYWGWEGPIVEICNERRIGVEVPMFGRKSLLWVAADEIEAI